MIELLMEQLTDYKKQLTQKEEEAKDLMRKGLEWKDKAREAMGVKMMIEATVREITKYS